MIRKKTFKDNDKDRTIAYSSLSDGDPEATALEKDFSTKSAPFPLQDFDLAKLPGIKTVSDKIALATLLLNILPPDEDYNYFDEEPIALSPGKQLIRHIAFDAFRTLPTDSELLESLGLSFMQLGDYEKSLKCYLRATEMGKPSSHLYWNQIAWCRHKLGRMKDALTAAKKALEINPEVHNLYDTCAAILSAMERKEEAIALIRRGMEKAGHKTFDLTYQLAALYEDTGEIDRAREYWKRYLDVAGNHFGHRKAIARACHKLSKHGESTTGPDFMRENRKELVEGMMSCHLLCYKFFEAFTELDRIDDEKRRTLGLFIEALCGSYNEIFDFVRHSASRKEKPILARHRNLMSVAHLLQGKLDDVEEWLHEASTLSSDKTESEALLYACYVMKLFEGVDESEEYRLLKAALKIGQKPGHAHILSARHFCAKRNFRKVEKIWKDVTRSEKRDRFSPQERLMLEETKFGVGLWRGVAKVIRKKDNEALEILSGLLKERPHIPELRYWLTVVYLRKGRFSAARDMFNSIPSGVLPEDVLSQMKGIFEPARISGFDTDDLFSNVRAPRMTGCSSSPLSMR